MLETAGAAITATAGAATAARYGTAGAATTARYGKQLEWLQQQPKTGRSRWRWLASHKVTRNMATCGLNHTRPHGNMAAKADLVVVVLC